jgi:hypothetical protein
MKGKLGLALVVLKDIRCRWGQRMPKDVNTQIVDTLA